MKQQTSGPASPPVVDDLLDRSKLIEEFSDFVKSLNGPDAATLSGRWGSGKSTFLSHWLPRFREQHPGTIVLSYNAWEAEIVDDPLIPFVVELQEAMRHQADAAEGKPYEIRALFKKVKSIAPGLALRGGLTLAQTGVRTLLAQYGISGPEIDELLRGAHILREEKEEADIFNKYIVYRRIVQKFQERTRTLLELMGSTTTNPTICIVDELDRCRPSYALNFLESLAHILTLDNLVFVIAVDREQLASVITQVYGANTKPDGYLRKIIHHNFNLEGQKSSFEHFAKQTFRGQLKRLGALQMTSSAGTLSQCFADVSSMFSLSLRDQQICATAVARSLLTGRFDDEQAQFAVFLLAFYYSDRVACSRLLAGTLEFPELADAIHAWDSGAGFFASNKGLLILVYLLAYLYPDDKWPQFSPTESSAYDYRIPNLERAHKALMNNIDSGAHQILRNSARHCVRDVLFA